MAFTEFDIIKRCFSDVGTVDSRVSLGVGDDCAVFSLPSDTHMCVSVDTQVEGVHFPSGCSALYVASRAMGAAVSDLAAMGGKPVFFTLALTLPEANEQWLRTFSSGLKQFSERYQMGLIGGDTTRGSLAVSVSVYGVVPKNGAVKRSGAMPGDHLFVSGCLGDAAAGLKLYDNRQDALSEQQCYLLERYLEPEPRIELGQALRPVASAMIDISDGLLADLQHLLDASAVGAEVDLALVPQSGAIQAVFPSEAQSLALTGGDDYELLFSVSEDHIDEITELSARLQVKLTQIGRVVAGKDLRLNGRVLNSENRGYMHFE